MINESPLLTDLYQFTMMQGYFDRGMEGEAVFEFFVRRLPPQRNFLIAAGLQQVIEYVSNLCFADDDIEYLKSTGFFHQEFLKYLRSLKFSGDIHAMPEGTIFFSDEPILRISAPLPVAQLVETRIINILQFQTMIASKAAKIRHAAQEKLLLDFGLRRSHAGEAGLFAARASYLAGFDGTATVQAGQIYGIPVSGTMAHSFVLSHDSEIDAFRHFAHSQKDNVVFLVDTYDIEQGTRKVVELAPELQEQGIEIKGVRIDSGDLVKTSRAVRDILDRGGLGTVKIFLSNSLDEYAIADLCLQDAPVDGFGVGTKLTTSSDYSFLDCSYKLVEYEGKGRRKRSASKSTLPGRKQVFRNYSTNGEMLADTIGLDTELLAGVPLVQEMMKDGQVLFSNQSLGDIRSYTQNQVETLPEYLKDIKKSTASYNVEVSGNLLDMASKLDADKVR